MSTVKIAWTKTPNSVSLSYNGETHTIVKETPEWPRVIAALKAENYDAIPSILADVKLRIAKYASRFTLNGELCFKGKDGKLRPLPEGMADRILDHEREGLPVAPLYAFAANLLRNPSKASVEQLFRFLEKNLHPITPGGNFIAYRRVTDDFRDFYTGAFDNAIGTVVSMPRNEVTDDRTVTCSNGLHVANFEYASKHYHAGQGRLVMVRVNPRDVVAVPTDYNEAKMRVCRFRVMSEITAPTECLQMGGF